MAIKKEKPEKITFQTIAEAKKNKQKIAMLTAYDYSFAKILDKAGIDIVFVGDSLGNVILGYENTLPVTMEDMIHHTKAVAKAVGKALLLTDMPYKSAITPEKALKNAELLIEAGAEGVKIEGIDDLNSIKEIIKAGIPVMGHLGFTPQKVKELGGYKIQRSPKIIDEAKKLEEAGVFSIVLEMIPDELAKKVTESVSIPTIGIGAGPYCNGQVLVTHDMLGLYEKPPSFVKKYADLNKEITKAVKKYIEDVKSNQ